MIDLSRTYMTRNGNPVKLLMTDGGGLYPVIGAVRMGDSDRWEPDCWRADGSYHALGSAMDLIEVSGQQHAA